MTHDDQHETPATVRDVLPDGTVEWSVNGLLHRDDGPARVTPDGASEWYQYGRRHREDGPAVIDPDGTETWYYEGVVHRHGGPAIVQPDGSEAWYWRGFRHREDGYAVLRYFGEGTGRGCHTQWWVVGRQYSTEEAHAGAVHRFHLDQLEHAGCHASHDCSGLPAPIPRRATMRRRSAVGVPEAVTLGDIVADVADGLTAGSEQDDADRDAA